MYLCMKYHNKNHPQLQGQWPFLPQDITALLRDQEGERMNV